MEADLTDDSSGNELLEETDSETDDEVDLHDGWRQVLAGQDNMPRNQLEFRGTPGIKPGIEVPQDEDARMKFCLRPFLTDALINSIVSWTKCQSRISTGRARRWRRSR